MRHAVSSASRGSRAENVRGAKLTEKRTRGVPCSFKCKQGLQGRKRQGRQIDGEKDAKNKEKKERERKREGKRGKEGNKKEKREERESKKEKRKKES